MKLAIPILLLSVLAAFWSGMYLLAKEPLEIDSTFEEALEIELGIPMGSFDQNKVKDITELDLSNYQLTDVRGIEYFRSLERLNLSHNLISTIDGLSALDNLQFIDLSFNDLTSIEISSPIVTEIDIESNQISDLSFVEGLDQLTRLTIRDNRIEDLSSLVETPALIYLNARGNYISSISTLETLINLQDVNLRNNQIKDFSPLQSLPALNERVYVTGNGATDYSALADIAERAQDIDFEIKAAPPRFSQDSGLIDIGTQITLESELEDARIYFTLDGSEPTPQSQIYTEPIVVEQELLMNTPVLSAIRTSIYTEPLELTNEDVQDGLIIRAAVYNNQEFSETVTNTYFVRNDVFTSSELPVISIAMNEDSLFSDVEGIYVPGMYYNNTINSSEGNYFQRGGEWEREAHIDFFSPSGTHEFSQNIGIRIHGGFSRSLAQKSLRLYAKSDYGQSRFYYPFFENNPEIEFNRLMLRNSGNDWNRTFFRENNNVIKG